MHFILVISEGSKQTHIPSWIELIGQGILRDHMLCFVVNFKIGNLHFVQVQNALFMNKRNMKKSLYTLHYEWFGCLQNFMT